MKFSKVCARVINMKKPKKDKIDISELNVPPEKHEYETARYFVNRGLDVIFDLRRMNTKSELKIIKILKKGCESSKMKTMLVIVKDGRLLTLKGRFIIMETR